MHAEIDRALLHISTILPQEPSARQPLTMASVTPDFTASMVETVKRSRARRTCASVTVGCAGRTMNLRLGSDQANTPSMCSGSAGCPQTSGKH